MITGDVAWLVGGDVGGVKHMKLGYFNKLKHSGNFISKLHTHAHTNSCS
jgi:hypothetical protein